MLSTTVMMLCVVCGSGVVIVMLYYWGSVTIMLVLLYWCVVVVQVTVSLILSVRLCMRTCIGVEPCTRTYGEHCCTRPTSGSLSVLIQRDSRSLTTSVKYVYNVISRIHCTRPSPVDTSGDQQQAATSGATSPTVETPEFEIILYRSPVGGGTTGWRLVSYSVCCRWLYV